MAGDDGMDRQSVDHQHLTPLGGNGPRRIGVFRGLDLVEHGAGGHVAPLNVHIEGTGLPGLPGVLPEGIDPTPPAGIALSGLFFPAEDGVVELFDAVQIAGDGFTYHR